MLRASADQTIYALSTSAMKAAIAVVRISGIDTDSVLRRICRRTDFTARRATLTSIFDEEGNLLDRALVIRFVAPHSFTGEEMVEFHTVGGRAVIAGLLRALGSCPGVRPAEAGEFAQRAFENGKIDLVEVEGLAAIVDSETKAQLKHAHMMAGGELSRSCERVRILLVQAMAHVESMLDFSDVEDATETTISSILPAVDEAAFELESLLRSFRVSERLRDGMTVVIAGPPNVGKSTLLNYLTKRDIAIVSPTAGTTRDAIETLVEIEGFPIIFVDTAGIRDTFDPVESEGVARARLLGARADLVLWLTESDQPVLPAEVSDWNVMTVRSKADSAKGSDGSELLAISAKTGQGIDELVSQIGGYASKHFSGASHVGVATERQRYSVEAALAAVREVLGNYNRPVEIIADDLRAAVRALGRISGRIEVEDVLGEIFSRLCVGK